jgi:hypothetical protein
MRVEQGGTSKWCPNCKQIRVCAAINPAYLGEGTGQRFYRPEHPDLNYFRRALVCQTCQHKWLTAEVEETFLDELVELRDALAVIKRNAEAYARESASAAQSLQRLSESLEVLRALQVYQQTPDPVLLLSVDALQLRAPTTEALKNAGIWYVGDLIQRSSGDLTTIPGLGLAAIEEAKETLASRGLTLGMNLT